MQPKIGDEFEPMVAELAMRRGLAPDSGSMEDLAVLLLRHRDDVRVAPASEGNSAPHRPARKRYIIAPSGIQRMAGPSTRQTLARIEQTLASRMVGRSDADAMKVLSLSPFEAALMQEHYAHLVIEEDVSHEMFRSPLLPQVDPVFTPASDAAATIVVEVVAGAQPVADARIFLLTDAERKRGYEGRTGPDGRATITLAEAERSFAKVIIFPRTNFWSIVRQDVAAEPLLRFTLTEPLRVAGFDWGHKATGADRRGDHLGRSVKVCIIDSGAAPHPSLKIAAGRNFILGQDENDWQRDADGHGTHCAGIVAALTREASVWGYAPQAELYVARIFDDGPHGKGFASDIIAAIDWALANECDIISMSFGGYTASGQVRKKIEAAWEAGVLCIAAAGNEAGAVAYPAVYPNVIGVSAIGQLATYPVDSIHVDAESGIRSSDGRFYLASFSNYGDQIDFCAPGVAVTSTLPGSMPAGDFGAWDGTSMACPHITGVAALALSAMMPIGQASRAEQGSLLVDKLSEIAVDLGLGRRYQGNGLPSLARLFGLATP